MTKINEHEAIRKILERVLKSRYNNIEAVSIVSEFCNNLYKMQDGETKELKDYDVIVECFKTLDGYDNQIVKYTVYLDVWRNKVSSKNIK